MGRLNSCSRGMIEDAENPLSPLRNTASTQGIAATALPTRLNVARLSEMISLLTKHRFPSWIMITSSTAQQFLNSYNPFLIDS